MKTTPNAKLRHDNSQIQFAAIESSPMAEDTEQSQMLTDRQKEVKERQKDEAALFPEIRSSPRTILPLANRRLPTLALKPSDVSGRVQEDEAISPSFPPDAMMNDFLGSSPTPSSSKKRSQEPYSDDGPPSSPPLMGSHLQLPQTSTSLNSVMQSQEGEQPQVQMDGVHEDVEKAVSTLPTPKSEEGPPTGTVVDSRSNDSNVDSRVANGDNIVASDMEVFVDAPTDQFIATEDLDTHKDSSQNLRSSRDSIENDEVTAQLMGEMAASSQNLRLPQFNMDPAGRVEKKRTAEAAGGPRKRQKAASTKQNGPVASSAGETVADCVLIDSQPRSSRRDSACHFVKQEPPTSPEPENQVTEPHSQPTEGHGRRKGIDQTRSEDAKTEGPTTFTKRRASVKGEQDVNRRSRRVTRTSSRLSDVATSSPIRSEASLASQEEAGTEAKWVSGPRGSKWAYIPSTAPIPAIDQPAHPPSPSVVANDTHEAARSEPAADLTTTQPASAEPRVEEESIETPTPSQILDGFKVMLEDIKKVTLRPEEERAMVAVLFESVQQVHEAGRRHRSM